jgi:hypothetical protein
MAYKVVNGKLVAIRNKRKPISQFQTVPEPEPKPLVKGEYLGLCNRQACLRPGANWYNKITRAHYCSACARMINDVCRDNHTELFCSKVQNKEVSNETV